MSLDQPEFKELIARFSRLITTTVILLLLMVGAIFIAVLAAKPSVTEVQLLPVTEVLAPPERLPLAEAVSELKDSEIIYGYQLLTQTDQLIGPEVGDADMRLTGNVLRCTNCHLQGGTQSYGISLVGVDKRFPQYRGREDRIGTLEDRINGCMTRSMNGSSLANDSREMKAMVAYISWLDDYFGSDSNSISSGLKSIELPDRAVDLERGKSLFSQQCAVCHQADGQGVASATTPGSSYVYPPLWGKYSYNNGAGMNRVITAAQFIKYNMPFGVTHENPVLSDEDAYDIAGYMNSHLRPKKSALELDFPDRTKKPMSTPYGPYADSFSEDQHTFGPYPPILEYYKITYGVTKKN